MDVSEFLIKCVSAVQEELFIILYWNYVKLATQQKTLQNSAVLSTALCSPFGLQKFRQGYHLRPAKDYLKICINKKLENS